MHHELLLIFLLGGFLFTGVYYLSNTLKNPALAALLSLIPIGVISAYLVKNKKVFNMYAKNALIVILINSLVFFIMFLLGTNTKLNYVSIISICLIIWVALQYCKYTLLEKYHPGFQTYKK